LKGELRFFFPINSFHLDPFDPNGQLMFLLAGYLASKTPYTKVGMKYESVHLRLLSIA
jgi:hypothetical protein